MCLSLRSEKTRIQVAKKDIICYKRLRTHRSAEVFTTIQDGTDFTGIICSTKCSGKISIEQGNILLCTDDITLDGHSCKNKHGFKYSWMLDYQVKSLIINNNQYIQYKTPYCECSVKIGKTYNSELIRNYNLVYKGLHSFKTLREAKEDGNGICVKCIIPTGSKYYIGEFCDSVSYASDTLTYVEIVK